MGRILLTRAVLGSQSDTGRHIRLTEYTTVATFSDNLIYQDVLAKYEEDLEKGDLTPRSSIHKSTDTELSLFNVSAGTVSVLSEVHAKSREPPKAGKVHLSHWMAVESKISPKLLALAYNRGAGIICRNDYPDIDLIIPVYLGGENETDLAIARDIPAFGAWNDLQHSHAATYSSVIVVETRYFQLSVDGNRERSRYSMFTRTLEILGQSPLSFVTIYIRFGEERNGV